MRRYLKQCETFKEKRLAIFKEYFLDERKKVLETKRKKLEAEEKVAIDHIFESEEKGEINEDNVLYNINVATVETTLWSIEWGIAELCNNPHMAKRIREELGSVLGSGKLITEPDIPRTPYLTCFVKEVMPLHMAIPLLVPPHESSPGEARGLRHSSSERDSGERLVDCEQPRILEGPREVRMKRIRQAREARLASERKSRNEGAI
ncbi:hypothetical protein R1sor_006997 [Riccia sorocarpa]|uniref:trans-cinnamate 4-monooxygenase n=1 Tax=Riccia sorocarpa TaxID=122646 RepID=A0ABD3HQY7_9MARC